ncbi:hypothetical protein O1Q96_17550 [Streptomyces sp. Qhu-G9]|uniref:hypothetical protein n=1 Tax=Streptomyces sp. Qhu-G9 TaxID=3452799 RepID=UPI0022AC033C|nr:hypothetical protein [Streptomyces aurantiacus]WAU81428.1 hypothetical protein O1Q96_17550 [Streptomyces aurantiacus]
MNVQGRGGDGQPEGPDGVPSRPEEVWLKFLEDSEPAIRESALREPSALERAQGLHPRPLDAGRTDRRARRPYSEPVERGTPAVGNLWQPEDPWPEPAWRDLDGRARLRRVGRVAATAAAIALALGAWSLLSTGGGLPRDTPDDTTVQRLEEAPGELSTSSHFPRESVSAGPSS